MAQDEITLYISFSFLHAKNTSQFSEFQIDFEKEKFPRMGKNRAGQMTCPENTED
jgi:hypothetical protein